MITKHKIEYKALNISTNMIVINSTIRKLIFKYYNLTRESSSKIESQRNEQCRY